MLEHLLSSLNSYNARMGLQGLHNKVFSMILEILVMKSLRFFKDKLRKY